MTMRDVRDRVERGAAIVRRVIGVPDYEIYAAHMARCHSGEAPLTPEEFSRQALKDKYSRPGTRCC